MKLKLLAISLGLAATSAFAAPQAGIPLPSFNDAPDVYGQPALATGAAVAQPSRSSGHPDPMHDSY